jgi:putative tryptophan/tyrosine transport system substrate-binding protein
MKRREFITLLGSEATLAMSPFAALAQQRAMKIPRIGIIDETPMRARFRQALHDLGYIEGETIAIESRVAEGDAQQLAEAAADLVRLPVDVIAVFGTPAAWAAQRATTTIPIVAMSIGDPLRAGLVPSLAQPGGNITGTTNLAPDIVTKRLEILLEALPNISRVALLWNPDNASNAAILEDLRVAVSKVQMTLVTAEVRSDVDFEGAFARMLDERPQALIITGDPLHSMHMGKVLEFLAKNRLPAMFQTKDHVVAGGLMSYGASEPEQLSRGAIYVHKILQGTKPADLPFEQPTTFELVINLKTAKALGLTIPPTLLTRADEAIE